MMVVFLLDVIRSAVITVVELRKFEIRKRSKGGDFVVRRVQKGSADDGIPAILKPKPKHRAKSTAAAPKVAPKFANMERPRFLPDPANSMTGTYGKKVLCITQIDHRLAYECRLPAASH